MPTEIIGVLNKIPYDRSICKKLQFGYARITMLPRNCKEQFMEFNPSSVQNFEFSSCEFDFTTSTAFLKYRLDQQEFCETFIFPGGKKDLTVEEKKIFQRWLEDLHLAAGVSYYKAAVPKKISTSYPLSPQTAEFFEKLYIQGLGEFAYQNKLDLREVIRFPRTPSHPLEKIERSGAKEWAIPLGGGKDSLVTLKAAQGKKLPITTTFVGRSHPILEDICQTSGSPHVYIHRHMDPMLMHLNDNGAYNGHIPISAILAFVFGLASVLYNWQGVVVSNERSANVGNLNYRGMEINHQYSKSAAFEKDFQDYIACFDPSFHYFSSLRPLSELAIGKVFAQVCQEYHASFTSCNRAYRIYHEFQHRWCLRCPKCRFVFLTLAPFLPKKNHLEIFGRNILAEMEQEDGFLALVGLKDHKPFECVGEVIESRIAFHLLAENKDWQDDILVQKIAAQLPKEDFAKQEKIFALESDHMPSLLRDFFRDYLQQQL